MTPDSIQETFAQLEYQLDKRKSPDMRRRLQFRAGWEDATKRDRLYTGVTLACLTWRNLGFRFGRHFGDHRPDEIDETFEFLADHYEVQHSENAESHAAPSAEMYISAFRKLGNISDTQIQMLRLHFNAPNRTISAAQMAHAVGYVHYSVANAQYGRLGRMIGERLEFNPTPERLGTLVIFRKQQSEWHWILRPQVAQALKSLGWVEGNAVLLPEEIAAATTLLEGAVCRVTVNAYERNPLARTKCIQAHGTSCTICKFNFGEAYGEVAEGFIHVHHLRPLSEIGGEYAIDPVEDLRPVCPNCHAVLHRQIPAFSIEEVQNFLCGRIIKAESPNQSLQ